MFSSSGDHNPTTRLNHKKPGIITMTPGSFLAISKQQSPLRNVKLSIASTIGKNVLFQRVKGSCLFVTTEQQSKDEGPPK